MTYRMRTSIALLCVLALVAGLAGMAGCTPSTPVAEKPAGETPVKGGTINFQIGEPAVIDPIDAQESEGIQVTQSVFDSLVDFDSLTSKIKPAAAESWKPNADATVWTFKLKKGAKFHNGREVKAADFKYAWERIALGKNASTISYHLAPVKGFDEMQADKATELSGVKVVDDYTLEVTLQYPFADFEYVVGHPALAPVPKEGIKLKAFADYYGDKPLVDGVDFKIYKDDESAFTDFKQGNLDFVNIPTGQIKATVAQYGESPDGYTMNPGKQTILGSELSTYYIYINTQDPITKNADLRKAMASAVNAQAICDVVYEGTRIPASGPVPAGIVGYQKNAWPNNSYDVARAKELLTKAGYPGGKGLPEIALSFNVGRGHEKVMQLIQADLAVVGIKVKLDGRPWETYSSEWLKIKDGKFANNDVHQMMRLGWLADYPIMDNFLYPIFESKSGDNKALYKNADVDKMLLEARSTTDGAARVKLYQDIEKKIGEDQPMIALVNYRHIKVGSDRVHNLVDSPMGLASLDKAWLTAGGK
jgi:oligopeptide transport system substrate-binding protein